MSWLVAFEHPVDPHKIFNIFAAIFILTIIVSIPSVIFGPNYSVKNKVIITVILIAVITALVLGIVY